MFSRFFQYFSSIFTKNTPVEESVPCDIRKVRETTAALVRSADEEQAYQTWLATTACRNWKNFLKKEQQAFAKSCKMAQSISLLQFEQLKCCQNFQLIFDNKIHTQADFTFLFDAFRDALLQNGYQLHVSDVRTYHCSEVKKETIERHYLKPVPILVAGEKLDQKFGNVTLTLRAQNGLPVQLSCRSTHYRDLNLYKPVRPMSEMIDCLVA